MGTELFYWIKLNMDFFNQDTIDWLKEQDNGCEYIVLYLQLCLLSANNNGVLVRHVGEMIIPYNAKKIAEQTRFSLDTVMVAMRLFTKLGLIEVDDRGTITLPAVPSMVGSRSASKEAVRKRAYRARKKVLALTAAGDKKEDISRDKMSHGVSGTKKDTKIDADEVSRTEAGQSVPKRDIWDKMSTENGTKCPTEYRDKSIDKKSSSNWKMAIDAYQNNIHPIANEAEKDLLLDMCQEYGLEWVTKAIEEAALQRAYTIKYVDGILRNWSRRGVADPWNYPKKGYSKEGRTNGRPAGSRNRTADSADSAADEIDWSQYDDTYKPGT